MSETALSRGIREALTAKGCLVLRQQAGMMRVTNKGNTRVIRMGAPGVPDLLVVFTINAGTLYASSGFGFLEVKTPKGKLSPAQEKWHEMAIDRAIRVRVARSIRDAVEIVGHWIKAEEAVNG